MDELADSLNLGVVRESLLEPVFECLDIVIGARLDLLHRLGVGDRELRAQLIELAQRSCTEHSYLGDRRFAAECLEPPYLDLEPQSDQAEFAEYALKRGHLAAVAAIQGRKCGEGRKRHAIRDGRCTMRERLDSNMCTRA